MSLDALCFQPGIRPRQQSADKFHSLELRSCCNLLDDIDHDSQPLRLQGARVPLTFSPEDYPPDWNNFFYPPNTKCLCRGDMNVCRRMP